ncbi:hypothetical protein C8J28_12430 [Cereibacter azotoformans]|uniref:Uncharacterized protein n=1 Tax=Cereibacter azotoformans TaxID=43057 RepID=A0A2T5JSZ2_9RHOB|nr:hypothetical protein C8J28_12430 [Cereibacter azotoformans]
MCVTMGVTVRHPHTEQVMSDNAILPDTAVDGKLRRFLAK